MTRFLTGVTSGKQTGRILPFLLVILAIFSQDVFGQITLNDSCHKALPFCGSGAYSYAAGVSPGWGTNAQEGPDYGCLGEEPNPAWYYLQVADPGDIIIDMQSTPLQDIDFICWGPFYSPTEGCVTGLTGNKIVDCSYSGSASETCSILGAQTGAFYMLLITNYSNQPCNVTFSQTNIGKPGAGSSNCDIVAHCSISSLTAIPDNGSHPNGRYDVSGEVEFSNAPVSGQLTITDITATPPVSQNFTAPFSSPLPYKLSGIICDGLPHTITAIFSDSTSCNFTQVYHSPNPQCPSAVISGGGTICNNGTDQVPVYINISGSMAPYNFTYALDGTPHTVNNYSGSFPYTITASAPGTYTMVSVSNSVCSGNVSGSATVAYKSAPAPTISGQASVCTGTADVVYSTEEGMNNYSWTISEGGTITSGGTSSGNSVTVTWNSSGAQFVSVSYTDPSFCSNEGYTTLSVMAGTPVTPGVSITVSPATTVYTGTTVTFTATTVNGGANPHFQWKKNGIDIPDATNSTFSSSTLITGDVITVEMISGAPCVTAATVVSNTVSMIVNTPSVTTLNIEAAPYGPICPGTPVTFHVTPGNPGENPQYKWMKNGNQVGENLPEYTDSQLRDNDVICCALIANLKDAGTMMIRSSEITMKVYNTKASFTITENFDELNGKISLVNTSTGANNFSWDFGNGETSNSENPTVTYREDGAYTISLTVTNDKNCSDTYSNTYQMLFKGLYIPNAFAPESSSSLGSVFKPSGMRLQNYLISVFDNTGLLVWHSNSIDEEGTPTGSWDGTYQGQAMPSGTYLWKVQASFIDNSAWKGSHNGSGKGSEYGTLLLIR
jgi:hypothetical protein